MAAVWDIINCRFILNLGGGGSDTTKEKWILIEQNLNKFY
jgi:hypothetical protein